MVFISRDAPLTVLFELLIAVMSFRDKMENRRTLRRGEADFHDLIITVL